MASVFTASDVERLVGPDTFERGADYARHRMVVSVAHKAGTTTILGQVLGSTARRYVTVIELSDPGEHAALRQGRCSCPVGNDCKHVAATLLAHLATQGQQTGDPALQDVVLAGPTPASPPPRSPSGPASSEWEQELAHLLDPGETPAATGAAPAADRRRPWERRPPDEIALQLGLAAPAARRSSPYDAWRTPRQASAPAPAPRLTLRPVVRGASGRWIRTGVSWNDLRYRGHRLSDYPDAHIEILRALCGLAVTTAGAHYYDMPAEIHADDLPGGAFWGLLADARRTGLPLVQDDKAQSPVLLDPAPARVQLVLARADSSEGAEPGVVLRGRISRDPGEVSPGPGFADHDDAGHDSAGHDDAGRIADDVDPSTVALLGTPPAGLHARPATELESRDAGSRPLILIPFAAPLDDTALRLLTRPTPLVVPAADERRFLARVLPALRNSFDDVLVEGDVTLPERPHPVLRLTVTRLPGHVTRLDWEWVYRVAPDPSVVLAVPLGAAPAGHLRDPDAEAGLLRRLEPRSERLRRGLPHEELRGMDTARFVMEELPELTALHGSDGFELAVLDDQLDGVPIDYRVEEHVEVAFGAGPLDDSRDWFDLAVTIRAGRQTLPFAEVFRALATGETHLLLVDGTHFPLDDERFDRLRELIDEARALQDTMGGTLRVDRFQVGLFEELERLGVLDEQTRAWRTAVGGLTEGARPEPVEVPAGVQARLRAYQREGLDWLVFLHRHGLGGVLADDMGLGKTLQALAFVQHLADRGAAPAPDARTPTAGGRDAGEGAPGTGAPPAPVLVVAPTSVVDNWVAEAARFTPGLRATAVTETRARRGRPLAETVAGADLVVTSYALFRLDAEEYEALPWGALILDEAQFVKNRQSVAYRCARRLPAPFKLALTGTPVENNLMELWAILSVVCPGLFPDPSRFADHYQRPIEKERDSVRLDRLRRRIAPFLLRRTKEQVAADLPAKQELVTEVTLGPRHRVVYDQYLQRERSKVLGLIEELEDHRFEVFRSLTVLRQASLDLSLVDEKHAGIPASKLEVLFEMLADVLAEGHNVLVFSQFTRLLHRVRDRLDVDGVAYAYLDGRTRKRAEAIERFTSGQAQVFLISLKAGGFGLNLTAADYCILLDPWWNPSAEAQAVDRAHRIGQRRNVMVYRLVAKDTIEEKVMALKATKSALVASVLDGAAAGGAGLTADDVRELLG